MKLTGALDAAYPPSYAASPAVGAKGVHTSGRPADPDMVPRSELEEAQREAAALRQEVSKGEAALKACEKLLQASLLQQEGLLKGRVQQDAELEALRQQLNEALEVKAESEQQSAQLRAKLAQQAQGIDVRIDADGSPRTPLPRSTPQRPAATSSGARSDLPAEMLHLQPISQLLSGLDESVPRSRAAAYWRRAQVYLRVVQIAEYWQAASRASAERRQIASPRDGSDSAARLFAAPLAALRRRLESNVRAAVAAQLLRSHLSGSEQIDAAAAAAAAAEAAEAVVAEVAEVEAPEAAGGGLSAVATERLWAQCRRESRDEAARGAAFTEALREGPGWAAAVAEATQAVIDMNMEPLTQHLRDIVHDRCATSVRALQAMDAAEPQLRLRALERARSVVEALRAAVANVQQQFVQGLRSSVAQGVRAAVGAPLLQQLCEVAVEQRCEALHAMADEEALRDRIWEEVSVAKRFFLSVGESGTAGWLASLLTGEAEVEMPQEINDFLCTHIARHLDPYLDGDVTSEEEERGSSPMLPLLQERYQAEFGRQLPVPPEAVLALYVCHVIGKADATHSYTDLVMGQGRLPISGYELERHIVALGKAVEAAVVKDFGAEHCAIQGVPVKAALVESLARQHSNSLHAQHQLMAEKLAEANRMGELGRKDEMKRIFGVEI